MRWEKIVRHQVIISVDGQHYKVICEDDGSIALSINGEYIKDMDALPEQEELVECVREYAQIEEMAKSEWDSVGNY